ncbi:MAG: tRNA pseudouridine(55) synthase TruB [Deltaproteobacteria bacterium]|nr:tRNA pseudouridine(55) synthase TruB [Deltaproteobacteria bacterium]MBI3294306.1 tRNA pseudouridine(55) synthase TruB [Deltaproteobacteria bacterium]
MLRPEISHREGLLVIDKHPGPTSFDVVREVKRLAGGEKVGHTGSLDPFASGVLVLLLGKATRLSQTLIDADKVYRAKLQLGLATATMDCTGEVSERKGVPEIAEDQVRAVLKGFEGIWEQVPPAYSAKKVNGVRLYELARQDIHVKLSPIPVKLFRVDLISFESPSIEFEVHCSKGTYVRSLAHEIGQRLGTVAHLTELRRLMCGNFSIDQSVTLDGFSEQVSDHLRKGYTNYVKYLRYCSDRYCDA